MGRGASYHCETILSPASPSCRSEGRPISSTLICWDNIKRNSTLVQRQDDINLRRRLFYPGSLLPQSAQHSLAGKTQIQNSPLYQNASAEHAPLHLPRLPGVLPGQDDEPAVLLHRAGPHLREAPRHARAADIGLSLAMLSFRISLAIHHHTACFVTNGAVTTCGNGGGRASGCWVLEYAGVTSLPLQQAYSRCHLIDKPARGERKRRPTLVTWVTTLPHAIRHQRPLARKQWRDRWRDGISFGAAGIVSLMYITPRIQSRQTRAAHTSCAASRAVAAAAWCDAASRARPAAAPKPPVRPPRPKPTPDGVPGPGEGRLASAQVPPRMCRRRDLKPPVP
jgi:hypothetical protein